MELKVRKLKTKDAFTISKIAKVINVQLDPNLKDAGSVGADAIKQVFQNMYMAEEEIVKLGASLLNLTEEQFNELGMDEIIEVFSTAAKNSSLISFFKRAVQ